MKSKKVWRYWCDHCGKGGCRKDAIVSHEASCIKNKKRKCRTCLMAGISQVATEDLVTGFSKARNEQDAVAWLRAVTKGCPTCMLATIIRFQEPPDEDGYGRWIDFDYKKERDAFWTEIHTTRAEIEPAMAVWGGAS